MDIVSLNGSDWEMTGGLPDDWRCTKIWETGGRDSRLFRKATVPGGVHENLLAHGQIPDPYFELNSLACEWVSERDWVFRKKFRVEKELKGKNMYLRFEGVDHRAYFYLNNNLLGEHAGGLTPFQFEVTSVLKYGGENSLYVAVEHAPKEQAQMGYTTKVKTDKARVFYGWDFSTRLIPLGIWGDVWLAAKDFAQINGVFARYELKGKKALLSVDTEFYAIDEGKAQVESTVLFEGKKVVSKRSSLSLKKGKSVFVQTLEVESVKLWNPNGYGEQALYEIKTRLLSAGKGRGSSAKAIDEKTTITGFRSFKLLQNPDSPRDSFPYLIEINGSRIFMKGWNWVPVDQLYARQTPEKYERLIKLAAQANVNIFRVWGGGFIEKRVFYELCSKYGIMVWQEFPLSSSGVESKVSDHPKYLGILENIARTMIPLRRNYPCLVMWCGGNELTVNSETPAMKVLKKVVSEIDPSRIFIPTSPWGPDGGHGIVQPGTRQEFWDLHGPWQYQGKAEQYRLFNEPCPLIHSECGAEGAISYESLEKFVSEEKMFPPDAANPVWVHHGQWWITFDKIKAMFGEIKDIKPFILASQFIHAEGLRYITESRRRSKFNCSGVLPWQINEPWPNTSCTSAVDYYTLPKMAYYYIANAYKPRHLSLRYDRLDWKEGNFKAQMWSNNSLGKADARFTCLARDLKGKKLYEQSGEIALKPESAQRLLEVNFQTKDPYNGIFVVSLFLYSGSRMVDRNDYVFSTKEDPIFGGMMDLPEAELKLQIANCKLQKSKVKIQEPKTKNIRTINIENTGKMAAVFVRLAAPDVNLITTFFSDNFIILFPEEEREIEITDTAGNLEEVRVSAWNSKDQVIKI